MFKCLNLTIAGRNILRGGFFDENFLMTVATLGAIAIHKLPEAVGVMLFFKVGELFQEYAVGKSRQ
jgi:Cd2+/Zn2+-exporting ATPase